MGFLPQDFEVPASLETGALRLRPITVHDVAKHYVAVMANREHPWSLFGTAGGWPADESRLA